jgi:hypothetical protein
MKDKFEAFRKKHPEAIHIVGYSVMLGVIGGLAITLRDRQIVRVSTGHNAEGQHFVGVTTRNGIERWAEVFPIEK